MQYPVSWFWKSEQHFRDGGCEDGLLSQVTSCPFAQLGDFVLMHPDSPLLENRFIGRGPPEMPTSQKAAAEPAIQVPGPMVSGAPKPRSGWSDMAQMNKARYAAEAR